MISIPITEEAYESLKARIPRIDQAPTSHGANGQMRISVDRKFVDRLLELRRPGESYSDVILRLATPPADVPSEIPSTMPLSEHLSAGAPEGLGRAREGDDVPWRRPGRFARLPGPPILGASGASRPAR